MLTISILDLINSRLKGRYQNERQAYKQVDCMGSKDDFVLAHRKDIFINISQRSGTTNILLCQAKIAKGAMNFLNGI